MSAVAGVAFGVGLALVYVFWRQSAGQDAAPGEADTGDAEAGGAGLGDWWAPAGPVQQVEEVDMAARNEAAFIAAIRRGEGTSGPNGYRTLFGGALFNSYADHPRVYVPWTDAKGVKRTSSAAGAGQIIVATWDRISRKLGLPDFSPASQDRAILELVRERGALGDVQAGRFAQAVTKVRAEWASMPGAGYGQPEATMAALQAAYVAAGGVLA